MLLFGAYRRPRELNWMVGLALFGVVALFALSGYLLPWDQKGYWAKLVEATIAGSAPVVGGAAQQLIQGGAAFGNLTLTRAYAFHAMALPALLIGLLVLHIYLFRRHGYTPKWSLSPRARRRRAPCRRGRTRRLRNAVVGVLVWGVVAVAVDRAPRRAARVAGRSDVELPGAPGVVRAAAVPAAHVLRGAAGDRRDDDHPGRRRRRWRSRCRSSIAGRRSRPRDRRRVLGAVGAGAGWR